jgi:hypothetical protein
MGGLVSSTAGVLRIVAKDIRLRTLTTMGYIIKQVRMLSQFAESVEGIIRGMMDAKSDKISVDFGKIIDFATPIAIGIADFVFGKDSDPEDHDPLAIFMVLVTVLTKINAAVCTVVAQFLKTKKDLRESGSDNMSLAQMVVDSGILETATVLITAYGTFGMTHSANIHLRSSAHLEINSLSYKRIGTETVDAAAPLAGYVDKLRDVGGKLSKGQIAGGIVSALLVLGGAGGGATMPLLYQMGSTDKLNKSDLDALKEL